MVEPLRCVSPDAVLTGWDFSTGAVKCLAFDLAGNALAEVRLPTDLWTEGGVSNGAPGGGSGTGGACSTNCLVKSPGAHRGTSSSSARLVKSRSRNGM